MRTTLLLTLLAFTLEPHEARACGGSYDLTQRILQVSTHGDGQRASVVWGPAPEADRRWTQLAPMSYDGAQIAPGIALSRPIDFTIISARRHGAATITAAGAQVVTGTQQVYLANTFAFRETATAIEVPASGEIAIEGAHPDATWRSLDDRGAVTAGLQRWVAARATATTISVSRVTETDLDAVAAYDVRAAKYVTFLKRGAAEVGRHAGRPLGVVELAGGRRLVLADGATTTSVAI